MFICFICKYQESSSRKLLKHLDSCHFSENVLTACYTCAQPGCARQFHLRNSFRKHLATHEARQSMPSTSVSTKLHTDHLNDMSEQQTPSVSDSRDIAISIPQNFLANLYSNPCIPRQAIQLIIENFRSLLINEVCTAVTNVIKQTFNQPSLEQQIKGLFEDSLCDVKTEFKRLRYFERLGLYIPPQEVVIGQQLDSKRQSGTFNLKPITCSEQFVPISKVLKRFFSIPNILIETINYVKALEYDNSLVTNITQGSSWKNRKKVHGNKIFFPLILFFDDYETGNVLGSHAGLHKLGAVYVSVGCLPPYYTSTLQCIFLSLLFHSSDRIRFGNAITFQPLINELKSLMNNGIEFDLPDYSGTIYFELAVIVGDNLGLHQLMGFVESFSANYPCRICSERKQDLGTMCHEDVSLLRNMSNYYEALQQHVSSSGIKEKCIWIQIANFDIFDRIAVDLMHDILEGTAVYVMTFLVKHYVTTLKLFSLQVLNERMFSFDYGPDQGSKPVAFQMEHLKQGKLKLSASEMLTFVRYFGLIVGDLIPTDETSWSLYLLLRKILDIVLCKSTSADNESLLQTIIEEFNELYLEISKEKLKPKFHFLLHYPRMAKKFGPLCNLWCMRFEAKHRVSKISARSSFNRRNVTKSLAMKHQLQLMSLFNSGVINPIVSMGKKITIQNSVKIELFQCLALEERKQSVYQVSWINVRGTKYLKNYILTINVNEDGPVFGLIKIIFVIGDSTVVFKCDQIATVGFCDHLHCYEVSNKAMKCCYVPQSILVTPIPSNYNTTPDGRRFVTLRDPL